MGDFAEAFDGQELREARLRLGLSQEALAEILSTTAATISRWESAGGTPQARFQAGVAKVLRGEMPEGRVVAHPTAGRNVHPRLTDEQREAIAAWNRRISSSHPLTDGEVAGFRATYRALGIPWPDE